MIRRLRRITRRLTDAAPWAPGSAVVLAYHRAAELPLDPWGLAVSPAHLEDHLTILSRWLRPVTAAGLADHLETRRVPRWTVATTFDDGYADLAGVIAPLLEKTGVPATMFVVADAVDRGTELWWDALERVLLETPDLPPELHLEIAGTPRSWTVAPLEATDPGWRGWNPPTNQRQRLYVELWNAVRPLDPDAREACITQLLAWAGLDAAARPSHRTLTEGELAELAGSPLVEIGAHSRTHAALGTLAPAAQRAELSDGRDLLAERVGRPVTTLAYPFGKSPDVTATTVALARETGYRAAFTTVTGRATARSDRFALPRLYVPDVDGEGFARLLRNRVGLRVG